MDWIYVTTAVFLVAFFVIAEYVRGRRAVVGTFRSFLADDPATGLLLRHARIDLPSGEQVTASLNGCVLCHGEYRDGDPVELNLVNGGYEVSVSLTGVRCPKSVGA